RGVEALDAETQVVRAVGEAQRLVPVDAPGGDELEQRRVEGAAPFGRRRRHRVLERVEVARLHELLHPRRVEEDLERRGAPAAATDSVSTPTSRWVTMDCLCAWANSIGSSMVTMCPASDALR